MQGNHVRARAARLGQVAVAGAMALTLAASCSSSAEPEQASSATTVVVPEGDPVDGGTLAVGIQNDVTGWNPTADTWGTAAAFAGSSMMEPLTTLDAEAEVQPWLATAWTANADFTTWTITLRDGVTFHDGTPFDADAVVANFDDVLASPLTGIALGGAIEGAEAIDARPVEINPDPAWAAFPSSFLAGPNAWMRAPAMLGVRRQRLRQARSAPARSGSTSWEPAARLKLEKNEDYWRDGEPHLDTDRVPRHRRRPRRDRPAVGRRRHDDHHSARDAADIEGDLPGHQGLGHGDRPAHGQHDRETAGGEPNPLPTSTPARPSPTPPTAASSPG